MTLAGRLAALALALCACIVWTCPVYCSADVRQLTSVQKVNAAAGHDHHANITVERPASGVRASASRPPCCVDCGRLAFVASSIPKLTSSPGIDLQVEPTQFASDGVGPSYRHVPSPVPLGTSPPGAGVSPLRI